MKVVNITLSIVTNSQLKNSDVDNIIINKINTTYLNNFDEFHFVLNSFDKNNSITIKNNSDFGSIIEWYEFKLLVDSVVKGSFTCIYK